MRNWIFLVILPLLNTPLLGQNILNPSFDSVYFGGIDRVFQWVTSDGFTLQSGMNGDTVLPLVPDTQYSAQGFLFSEILWMGNRIDTTPYSLAAMAISNRPRFRKANGDPWPGFVINGDHVATDSTGYPDLSRCGIPFTYRPTKLKGFYWFVDSTLLLNNFGRCVLLLKKWNPSKGYSDTIAFMDTSIPFNPMMGPEPFEITIPYRSPMTPDSIMVAFFGGQHPQQPSTFWLDEISFDYTPIGLSENPSEEISAYPNPANDRIRIDLPYPKELTIRMISINGEEWEVEPQRSEGSISIDISHLPPGSYFLVLTSNEHNRWARILKK